MARNGKIIFGAVIGALFGMAFAPKKGSELRKDVKSELEKGGYGEKTLQKSAKVIVEDLMVTGKELYNDPEVQKQIKRGKKEVQKLAIEAKDKLQESGQEWIKVARKEVEAHKKTIEKEITKKVDSIQKKVAPKVVKPKTASKPTKKSPKK